MFHDHNASPDVVVIGGGVIGLACAWRIAQRGLRVTVLERGEPGGGTSRVAAGMLAPVSEADPSERPVLDLGIASARRYPGIVGELIAETGCDPGYLACGTLRVARDPDEAEALERELELRHALGLSAERLLASKARRLEPALAPTLRLGVQFPDDHAVDPRTLTATLAVAVRTAGGSVRTGVEVTGVVVSGGRVGGVTLASGEPIAVEHVVIAAGAWSEGIDGIPPEARVPVHPVKGQILRLRDPAGPGLLSRVLRMADAYVVPRGDGRYVLGATMEERGFDVAVTAGAVFELLRDALELLPGLAEMEVVELSAGSRPATPDNAPAIGPSAVAGLHWATGHYRNGILLAPITAELVLAGLLGEAPPDDLEDASAFAPGRFVMSGAGR